jgi:hypothetical protein
MSEPNDRNIGDAFREYLRRVCGITRAEVWWMLPHWVRFRTVEDVEAMSLYDPKLYDIMQSYNTWHLLVKGCENEVIFVAHINDSGPNHKLWIIVEEHAPCYGYFTKSELKAVHEYRDAIEEYLYQKINSLAVTLRDLGSCYLEEHRCSQLSASGSLQPG